MVKWIFQGDCEREDNFNFLPFLRELQPWTKRGALVCYRPNLSWAPLPHMGLFCLMNLPCPTETSLLWRQSYCIAQICSCTMTGGEHQPEMYLMP